MAVPRRTPWLLAIGLTSIWLVYPIVSGPLALLRDFWSWFVLCIVGLLCLRQRNPLNHLLPALAWGLAMAALANAGQSLLQAYQLWRNTAHTDVYGFLHQRNQLATLCLLGLAALGWIHAVRPTSLASKRLWANGIAAMSGLLGAVISLSASRTGLLGMVLLWLAMEALVLRYRSSSAPAAMQLTLRMAVLGYVLALVPMLGTDAPSLGILARQNAQEGANVCSSRLSLWANVLELIAIKPWWGWGWGELDYAHFVTLFQSERFCALLSNAHNLPLQLAVELGIPVALAACSAALWCLFRGTPWREQHPDRLLGWGLLLPIVLHSMLEYPWWYGPFQVTAALAMWILWRSPHRDDHHSSTHSVPLGRYRNAASWMLAAGLALVIFAAADYVRASQIYLQPSERLPGFRHNTQQQIRKSVFFQDQIDFADLGLTAVDAENAATVHALALKMLQFSPEAMVGEKLLASTHLLGLKDEYEYYQVRLTIAFPDLFTQRQTKPAGY
ncbi:MAG: polymerase [Rhodoferax sp.]|nr:MAG: polymerase [Rhodoferax sp.]